MKFLKYAKQSWLDIMCRVPYLEGKKGEDRTPDKEFELRDINKKYFDVSYYND